jgi:anti-anti-sigma factor
MIFAVTENTVRDQKPVMRLSSPHILFGRQGARMQIHINDIGSKATVVMVGRLDIPGAEVVALPLAALSGSKSELIIDMAGVTFIASIGLRHLATAAKVVRRRGGRLILLNPAEAVADVVTASGLTDYLPIERAGAASESYAN